MAASTVKPNETVASVEVHSPLAQTPNWGETAHGIESVVTTIGLLVAAWWAWRGDLLKSKSERAQELRQREREEDGRREVLKQRQEQLRWDQARVARDIIREFLSDVDAQTALNLVDCDTKVFEARDSRTKNDPYSFDLGKADDVRALRLNTTDLSPQEVFLRRCFDAWFFWMAVIEEHLRSKLILPADVDFVCRYYVRYLKADPALFDACLTYIRHYDIGEKVLGFIDRYASPPN